MPPRSLPHDPSLEHLRKEAKRLLKSVRAGDGAALAQVAELHPRGGKAADGFSLSDAQIVTARAYGFPSWARLKQHLASIEPLVWKTPPSSSAAAPVDRFIRLACLVYGDWDRSNPTRARRLLAEQPELSRASIYAAAAAGDVAALHEALDRDPSLVNARGGPLGWEPLLYACYSRLDDGSRERSTVEAARLLLARGADPNAGFLWNGTYAFTGLTGAFGEGEDSRNELPHPQCESLARLLLEAGADPNDSQALYNRHFNANDDHLKLLFAYGLGEDKGGPWLERLRVTPQRLLVEELWGAAKRNFGDRVALLIEHGTDVNTPGIRNGRTPYEEALRAGNDGIAEYLLRHGAKKIELDRVEQFALACIAGRRDEVRAMLAREPTLLDALGHEGRVELIHRAVEAHQREGVRLIVELGVDVNAMLAGTGLDRSPLHGAAMAGDVGMIALLLELGADRSLRDFAYHATPIAWANYGRQRQAVDYLLPYASIFDAVQCDGVERAAALLREDPSLALARDADGSPIAFYLHPNMTRFDEMVRMLTSYHVDLNARAPSGRTVLDRTMARAALEFADALRAHGARTAAELDAGA